MVEKVINALKGCPILNLTISPHWEGGCHISNWKETSQPIARQAGCFFCMTSPSFLIGGIGGDSYRLGGGINTNLALLRIAYIYIIHGYHKNYQMINVFSIHGIPGYPFLNPLRVSQVSAQALPHLATFGRRRPGGCTSFHHFIWATAKAAGASGWWPWWLGDDVMEKSLSHDTILR